MKKAEKINSHFTDSFLSVKLVKYKAILTRRVLIYMTKKIAVIGAGNMGGAIVCRMLRAGYENVVVAARSEATLEKVRAWGASATDNNLEAVNDAEIIILAVKPNIAGAVADEIKGEISENAIIVSVCAGLTVASLKELFDHEKVVRVMPNTPVTVGEGMCVVCESDDVSAEEFDYIKAIFSSFGKVLVLPESLIDTVIGVSGSGPAYAFMFIDGMVRSGVKNGLDYETAKIMAAQTVLGAAKMVLESGLTPDQLKVNVCSPGGTTIEAVRSFEEDDLYGTVDRAMAACIAKSKKMSESK